jgi:orotidine-5'-phosphate decarboxylase
MKRNELIRQIQEKKSFLCVGLDSSLDRIPQFLLDYEDPIFEFNKRIIDATKEYCVAYKPNTAFYEANGVKGWETLQKTIDYIPNTHFSIADAKRGDIGNTSKAYAKAFFETLNFDAITVAPYMGEDSILPFYEYEDKWVIVLGLTSNKGSSDFQMLKSGEEYLFEKVLAKASSYGSEDNTMFVVGATQTDFMKRVRRIIPNHFLLIPGVGAQGGDLESTFKHSANKDTGILVNSSRSIIYASSDEDFDVIAGTKCNSLHLEMNRLMSGT